MNTDAKQIQQAGQSFLKSLFDLSFSEFITPKIIKVLYIIAMAVAALVALVFIIVAFAGGGAVSGIFALIFAPVVFILYVIMARVWLELVMVFFSMNDKLKSIEAKTKS